LLGLHVPKVGYQMLHQTNILASKNLATILDVVKQFGSLFLSQTK
jgi:hypothetical protein